MYSAWLIVGTQHMVIMESKYKRREGRKVKRKQGEKKRDEEKENEPLQVPKPREK